MGVGVWAALSARGGGTRALAGEREGTGRCGVRLGRVESWAAHGREREEGRVRWLASGRERAVAGFGWAEWGAGVGFPGEVGLGLGRGLGCWASLSWTGFGLLGWFSFSKF